MNIREISDVFKDTANQITALKSYNFGWASDRTRSSNTEDYQELNEFPRVFFSVPTIIGSDQTRKQDTYQVTLFFDDLLGYNNEGDADLTLQLDKWATLQVYATAFLQRLNKIKQSILPNYIFIPDAPAMTFDSFTGLQRMITVQLSFTLVVPTNCEPVVSKLVECIANIVTSSNLTASLTSVIKLVSILQASSSLSANLQLTKFAASSLNANASLAASALVSKLAASSLTGAGTLIADLTVTGSATLLLDLYPNAAAAYSLRKLRTAYTGSAIRVRRSSDNTEQDIGFVNNVLNTSALTTFCGVGNGFVTTWYDQSGNAYNATETTAANQPQIVSSGSVILDNSKPCVSYYNTTCRLQATATALNTAAALCTFEVFSSNAAAAADVNSVVTWHLGDNGVSNNILARLSSTGAFLGEYMFFDVRRTTLGLARLGSTTYRRNANTQVLESSNFINTGTSFYQNNNLITLDLLNGNASTSANYTPANGNITGKLWLGVIFASPTTYISVIAKFSEMIFYPTNQLSDRTNIQTNINTHYAIY
jgi:hypothetical protein